MAFIDNIEDVIDTIKIILYDSCSTDEFYKKVLIDIEKLIPSYNANNNQFLLLGPSTTIELYENDFDKISQYMVLNDRIDTQEQMANKVESVIGFIKETIYHACISEFKKLGEINKIKSGNGHINMMYNKDNKKETIDMIINKMAQTLKKINIDVKDNNMFIIINDKLKDIVDINGYNIPTYIDADGSNLFNITVGIKPEEDQAGLRLIYNKNRYFDIRPDTTFRSSYINYIIEYMFKYTIKMFGTEPDRYYISTSIQDI